MTDCYCGSQKCPCGSQHCSNKEESCTKIDGNVACECSDVNAGPNEFGVDCGGLCNRPCRGTPPDWKMIELIRVVGDTASSIDVVFIPDATYEGHLNQFRTDVIKLIRNGFFHLDLDITKPLPDNYRDQFNFYIYVGGFGPIPFRDYAPSADIAVNLYNADVGGGMAGCGGPELTAPGRYIPVLLHELGHALWGLAGEREDCGSCNNPNDNCDCNGGLSGTSHNTWTSKEDCEHNALLYGWVKSTCSRICKSSYWRYDNTNYCIMGILVLGGEQTFGEACSEKISQSFIGMLLSRHFNITKMGSSPCQNIITNA